MGSEPNSYSKSFLDAISLRIALDEAFDASGDIGLDAQVEIAAQLQELNNTADKIEQGLVVDSELEVIFADIDRIRGRVGIGPAQRYRSRWAIRG